MHHINVVESFVPCLLATQLWGDLDHLVAEAAPEAAEAVAADARTVFEQLPRIRIRMRILRRGKLDV